MKKILFLLFFFLSFPAFIYFPKLAFAHPGRTDANGCHYCKSCTPYGNLYEWNGKLYEYYHCHNQGDPVKSYVEEEETLSSMEKLKNLVPRDDLSPVVIPPVKAPTPLPVSDNSWFEEWKQKMAQLEKEEQDRKKKEQEFREALAKETEDKLTKLSNDIEAAKKKPKTVDISPYPSPKSTVNLELLRQPSKTIKSLPSPTPKPSSLNVMSVQIEKNSLSKFIFDLWEKLKSLFNQKN